MKEKIYRESLLGSLRPFDVAQGRPCGSHSELLGVSPRRVLRGEQGEKRAREPFPVLRAIFVAAFSLEPNGQAGFVCMIAGNLLRVSFLQGQRARARSCILLSAVVENNLMLGNRSGAEFHQGIL